MSENRVEAGLKLYMSAQALGAAKRIMRLLRLCPVVALAIAPKFAFPQEPRYWQSAEYQAMLAEMRSAAPSPAYIATGSRPAADSQLHVEVQESADSLQLATTAARLVWSKPTGQLTWTNLATDRSWTIGAADTSLPRTSDAAPACASGAARIAFSHSADGSRWIIPCGDAGRSIQVEFLHADLARVTFTFATEANCALELHVAGGGPYFGLGERFWQAGLSGTSLDVTTAGSLR